MRANGLAVTVVRQAKGWTQSELADQAAVSQSFISKVENGQLELENDQLWEVARVLEVPVDLLQVRDQNLGSGVSCVHHRRKRSQLKAGAARKIEGITHLASLTATNLIRQLEQPIEVSVPKIYRADQTIPDAATALREQLGLGSAPIKDLIGVVESLGIVVILRDLGTDAQDAVSLYTPGRHPVIIINTSLSGDRQRFSLAHETAHIILHGWHVMTGEERVEREANMFAGALLAPPSAMKQELAGLGQRDFRRLVEMKQTWGISIGALVEQARILEILDEDAHRTLRIKLNELGWTKVEPGHVEGEVPHLVRRIVDLHIDELGRTMDKVASIGLMLPEPFMRHFAKHRSNLSETQETVR